MTEQLEPQRPEARRSYYGIVGNGETAALIGPDLAVRWLCLPRYDGTPFFASALDPRRGGQLEVALNDRWLTAHVDGPVADTDVGGVSFGSVRVQQEYMGRTNVLSTCIDVGSLRLQAADVMPWGRPLLVRRLTVTNTGRQDETPRLSFRIHPVASVHWSFDVSLDVVAEVSGAGENFAVTAVRAKDAALVAGWVPDDSSSSDGGTSSTVTIPSLAPGATFRTTLVIAYGNDVVEARSRWEDAAAELASRPPGDPAGLQRELRFWTDWLSRARFPTRVAADFENAYARGLLTLKLLTHEASGAIVAAPTASWPAVPGGHDNWDYRFCWLRDGYYTARTFDEAGLHDEARAFYEFALRCQGDDGHWTQPLYTLDGGRPEELLVDDLEGPGGERPLRFGNAAHAQLQIDNEPSILHGLWVHAQKTGDKAFAAANWGAIRQAAEAMMRLWHQPENGIWEIRERRDHWVYGKALCVAGFRAAAALAQWLGHDNDAQRWQVEAETVRAQVIDEGYCPVRRAYLQTYDKHSPLDISALALVLWDVLPADDQRMQNTVACMERPLQMPALTVPAAQPTTDDPYWGMHEVKGGLAMDGAFARYDYAAEPFYLPTLWMARYYLRVGRRDCAEQLVRLCLHNATDLGLMAEHFNPRTGRQWGNFPQAFSHEELALTILELGS